MKLVFFAPFLYLLSRYMEFCSFVILFVGGVREGRGVGGWGGDVCVQEITWIIVSEVHIFKQ